MNRAGWEFFGLVVGLPILVATFIDEPVVIFCAAVLGMLIWVARHH